MVYFLLYFYIFLSGFVFSKSYLCDGKLHLSDNSNVNYKINIFYLSTLIVLTLFAGFRDGSVGVDTNNYIEMFYKIKNSDELTLPGIEYGYILLNRFIGYFFDNYFFILLSTSFLIYFLQLSFLKNNSKDFFLSVILYFGFNFFFTSMVSLRQYIAMGFSFVCFTKFYKKRIFSFIFFAFLSFMFHYTTILFIVAVFMSDFFSKNKKRLIILFILSFFCIPILIYFYRTFILFIPKFSFYAQYEASGEIGKVNLVYIVLVMYCLIEVLLKKKNQTKKNYQLSCFLIFYICILILGIYIPYMFRLSYYFSFFILIMLPEVIDNKVNIKIILIFLAISIFTYNFYMNSASIYPYALNKVWIK